MTAIFTSAHLGFFDSSLNLLGQNGTFGDAALGQGNERVYVNAATGNLVLQRQDEVLVGKGLDARLIRTYNSLGLLNDNNSNNWRLNVEKDLEIVGAINQAGSQLIRTSGDGSEITFHFVSPGLYRSTSGSGAHDTFSQSGSNWIWQEGSSLAKEYYNGAGQLIATEDADGNGTSYGYTGGNITKINMPNGQTVTLNYVGNNLQSISTLSNGVQLNRVSYEYDVQNRLTKVSVDLSPGDSDITDGHYYATYYGYDGTSRRVSSVSQSDGTSVYFTYVNRDGKFLVKTVTDGTNNVTTYNYYNDDDNNGVWEPNADANGTYTEVVNPIGEATRFYYSGSGFLTRVESPAVNGQPLVTQLGYADDNLSWVVDASGNRTDYRYDNNGNQILSRDGIGNTVERFYSSDSRLLRETIYLQPDPDAIESGADPTDPVTRYFVYDDEGHLRFTINGEREVSEQRYSTSGELIEQWGYRNTSLSASLSDNNATNLLTLENWVSALADRSQAEKTVFDYDFRGQLETTTSWNSLTTSGIGLGTASITRMVYDQRGQLVKTITPRGEATVVDDDFTTRYIYDGLGRLLQTIDAKGTIFTTGYDDAGSTVSTQNGLGLTTSSVFDAAGRLLSMTRRGNGNRMLGQTTYHYDNADRLRATTDIDGSRSYLFYDTAGRLHYEVDAFGAVKQSTYTRNGQLETTHLFKNTVSTTDWFNPNTGAVTLDTDEFETHFLPTIHDEDRRVTRSYDNSNRLVAETDGIATTTHIYNGANQKIKVIVAGAGGSRESRLFYDDAGRQSAALDPEGYLILNEYDELGHLIQQVRYAKAVTESLRESGELNALLVDVQSDSDLQADNQTLHYFYNAKGLMIGEVDAEGYLTETMYNLDGKATAITRYTVKVTVNADQTIADIRPPSDSDAQTTEMQYDELGRLQATIDAQGNANWFDYDTAGNVRRVVMGERTQTGELRYKYNRYDEAGRLVGSLDTKSSTMLGGTASDSEIDAHLQSYGTRSVYDDNGRLTQTIDALGYKTLFYYNERGEIVYSVNALGEVTKNFYNAFGDVTKTRLFATRINTVGLPGGSADGFIEPPVNNQKDTVTKFRFNSRGLVREVLQQIYRSNAVDNITTTNTYSTWGELQYTIAQKDFIGNSTTSNFTYDKRGLVVNSTADVGSLNRTTKTQYDAFGRATRVTDANNEVSITEYDRLGRIIVTTDALNHQRTTAYDAFSRVLTQTDSLKNTTHYFYDTANRRMTMTLPDGTQTTSVQNEFGETVEVIDGKGQSTVYKFDENGQQTKVTDALGNETIQAYDKLGRLEFSFDAEDRKIKLTYDAVNRLWQRIIDPDGLGIVTEYTYDAKGQAIQVKDPNGMISETTFNKLGQVTQVVTDLFGKNLTTTYDYDAQGNQVTLVNAANTTEALVTKYYYDSLGQLISTQLDPSGQNIVTIYKYDNNGNMTKKTDALGKSDYYVYDELNRLTYSIDKLGYASKSIYDSEGRVIETRRYEQAVDPLAVPFIIDGSYISNKYFYDANSRLKYSIDAEGFLSESIYDANGNTITTRRFTKKDALVNPSWSGSNNLTNTQSRFEKVSGGNGWNARSYISNAITEGTGEISFRVPGESIQDRVMVGLNTLNRRKGASAPDYGIQVSNNALQIFEDGVLKHSESIILPANTEFRIQMNGKNIDYQYRHASDLNFTTFYSSTKPVNTEANYNAEVLIYNEGAVVDDLFVNNTLNASETKYLYDEAGRNQFVVNAEGYLSENVFDKSNNIIQIIQYELKPPASHDLEAIIRSDIAMLSDDQIRKTQYFYDDANRQRFIANAGGFITEMIYNARGQVVETKAYENLTIDDIPQRKNYNLSTKAENWQAFGYNRTEATISSILDKDLKKPVTRLQGSGFKNIFKLWGDSKKTSWNETQSTNIQWKMKYDENFLIRISAQTADGVRQFTYHPNNMKPTFNGRRAYRFGIGTNKANGQWETFERNLSKDLQMIDPSNKIIKIDSFSVRGSGLISDVKMTGLLTADDISSYLTTLNNGSELARTTYAVHDSSGRTRFNINALGEVTENIFDAASRVIETVAYASPISNIATVSKTEETIAALLNLESSRHSYFVHDSIGQVRFTINSVGYVTENVYDVNGQVTESIQFETQFSGNPKTATEASLSGFYSLNQTASDRKTTHVYDAKGQVIHAIDANNQYESFTYNAFGDIETYTNKKRDTWHYQHDKLGNLTEERTPKDKLYYSDINGSPVAIDNASIVSSMAYDYMGHLIRHEEGILDNGTQIISTNAVVTSYTYDKLGNQIKVTYPPIGNQTYSSKTFYDAFGNAVVNQDVAGNYSYRVYDALNRQEYAIDAEGYLTAFQYDGYGDQRYITRYTIPVSSFETQGNLAFTSSEINAFETSQSQFRKIEKQYDDLGRVTRTLQPEVEVYDPATNVTYQAQPTVEVNYNSFGEVVERRTLEESNGNSVWSRNNFYFNKLGQQVGAIDAGGYYTISQYNAFGEVERIVEFAKALSSWGKTTPPTQVTTNHRSDSNFDESLGPDRIRSFSYDSLGRQTHEYTESHSYQSSINSTNIIGVGQSNTRHLMVTNGYDVLGNLEWFNQQGVVTLKGYNKLGHSLHIEQNTRRVLTNTDVGHLNTVFGEKTLVNSGEQRSPYTTFKTDAFGNILEEHQYALGKSSNGTIVTSQQDIISTFAFDAHGNKVKSTDGEGHDTLFSYDRLGNIVKESKSYLNAKKNQWYTAVTEFGYDRVGQQVFTEVNLSSSNQLIHAVESNQVIAIAYNSFGEVVARGDKKRISGELLANYTNRLQERFVYDSAGRMIESSGSDTTNNTQSTSKKFKYNLQGLATYEDDGDKGMSKHHYDSKGQRTKSTMQYFVQTFSDENNPATFTPEIRQEYDRWGNVTQLIDTRGYVYNYVYNENDQLVKEVKPKTLLVKEDTTEDTDFSPVTEYGYDIQGRQTFIKDAAGNVRQKVFDTVGQVVKEIDGLGNETHYAFDVLGRQVGKESALGYITTQQFDRLNKAISQGDVRKTNSGVFYNQALAQFEYNALGHQTLAGFAYGIDANSNQTQFANKYTDYDVRGNVIRTETATGLTVRTHYDSQGRKDWEKNGLYTSGNAHEHRWTYDYFGKTLTYNNLNGTEFTYEYNVAGQLHRKVRTVEVNEVDSSGNYLHGIEYSYYENGLLKTITDKDTNTFSYYEYDENGQRIYARTEGTDARGFLYDNVTKTSYDELGRISGVDNIDLLQNLVTMKATYVYDEVGNRRAVQVASEYDFNYVEPTNTPPTANGFIDDTTLEELDTQSIYLGQSLFSDADIPRGDQLSFYALREYGHFEFVNVGGPKPTIEEIWRSDGYNELDSWMSLSVTDNNEFYLNVDQPPIGSSLIAGEGGNGHYRVLVRAEDRSGASASLFFTLTIDPYQNKAPTATAIPDKIIDEGDTTSFDVSNAFSDFENDELTFYGKQVIPRHIVWEWDQDLGEYIPIWVEEQELSLPTWVTVTADGVVQIVDAPADDQQNLSQLIRIYARETSTDEEYTASSDFNLTVLATNDAPQVDQGLPDTIHAELGLVFDYTIPANAFTDINGDQLSYSVSGLPNAITFNPSLRRFGGTPTLADIGSYVITVTATDSGGLSATETFTLSINGTPVANGFLPNKSYQATRNFTFHTRGPFSDPNGDLLNYETRLVVSVWIPPEPGFPGQWIDNYEALPGWLNFNSSNAVFSGAAPQSATDESFTIQVRANDGMQSSEWREFDLAITAFSNQPPTAEPIPDQSINEGQQFHYQVPSSTFNDPDAQALSYSAKWMKREAVQIGVDGEGFPIFEMQWIAYNLPSWLSFNTTTRDFSGIRNGISADENYKLRVIATEIGTSPALSAFSEFNLSVNALNNAPQVNQGLPALIHAEIGDSFNYTIPFHTFIDINGDVLSYGVAGLPSSISFNSLTRQFSGTPSLSDEGSYTVTVTVTDPDGLTASDSFTLSINGTPVANGSLSNRSYQAMRSFSFNARAPFSDPNGDLLNYESRLVVSVWIPPEPGLPGEWIETYHQLPSWLNFNSQNAVFSGTAPASAIGDNFTIQVLATDGMQSSEWREFDLAITPFNNLPPNAGTIPNQSVNEGQAFNYQVLSNTFSDPDGQALSYSAKWMKREAIQIGVDGEGFPIFEMQWIAYNLPSWLSFDSSTRTFNGTRQGISLDETYKLRVTATEVGTTPALSAFSEFDLSVIVANDAPNLNNPPNASYVMEVGEPFALDLPQNTFEDVNNDALTYSVRFKPSWMTFNATQLKFTATPSASFAGISYNVSLRATDEHGAYVERVITFIVNSAPVDNGLPLSKDAPVSTQLNYNVANYFSDPDGQSLTYTATLQVEHSIYDPEFDEWFHYTTYPELPSWLNMSSTGQLTGTPPNSEEGNTHTILVEVTDGNSPIYKAFNLNIVGMQNSAPELNIPLTNQSIAANATAYFQFSSSTFIDPNGDSLTYSARLGSGASLPSWISFNSFTRRFTFNPQTSHQGSHAIRVFANDGNGGATSDVFIVSVGAGANQSPYVNAQIPNQSVTEGSSFDFVMSSIAFRDPDGDPLGYSAKLANGAPLPSWISFNTTTRRFVFNPSSGQSGSYDIRVTAQDPSGLQATDTFRLTVNQNANNAPTVNTPIPNQSGIRGSFFAYIMPNSTFADSDGDTLTLSAKLQNGNHLPSWLHFNSSTGRFSGTPSSTGSYTLRVTASDGRGGSVYDDFTLTITSPANQLPTLVNPISNQQFQRFESIYFHVPANTFNDPDGDTLTYTASLTHGSQLPFWLSFNSNTRLFEGFATMEGDFGIRVTASDGSGGSVSDNFLIMVSDGGIDPQRIETEQKLVVSSFAKKTTLGSPTSSSNKLTVIETAQLEQLDQDLRNLDDKVKDDLASFIKTLNEHKKEFTTSDIHNLSTIILELSISSGVDRKVIFYEQLEKLNRFLDGVKSNGSDTTPIIGTDLRGDDFDPIDPRFDPDDLPDNVRQYKEYWYTYDAENRITLAEGYKKNNGNNTYSIDIKEEHGSIIKYDAIGNQVMRIQQTGEFAYDVERFNYNKRGQLVEANKVKRGVVVNGTQLRDETQRDNFYNDDENWQLAVKKVYDLAGRVAIQRDYYLKDTYKTVRVEIDDGVWEDQSLDVYGALKSRQETYYDMDGRARNIANFGITQTFWSSFTYFGLGQGDYDFSDRISDNDLARLSSVVYGVNSFDSAGQLKTYQYIKERKGEGDNEQLSSYTYTYGYTYLKFDSYLQQMVNGQGSNGYQKSGYNITYYDKNGRAEKVIERYREEQITTQNHRYFRNNGDGQVIYKEWGDYNTNTNQLTIEAEDKRHFFYSNGDQIGSIDGKGRILFDEQAGYNLVSASGMSNDGTYSVQQGDSLRSIARMIYGSEAMWYVIADANGLTDDNVRLEVGQTLKLPAQDTNVNDANTFKAYNLDELIGDRTPAIPYVEPPPRPDNGCGALGSIIMIVVTVIVTIYTAGAALGAMGATGATAAGTAATAAGATAGTIGGTLAAGASAIAGSSGLLGVAAAAAGGFVGSVAGQLVGKAVGVVDSFSLKDAFANGLTSAASAFIGGQLQSANWATKGAESVKGIQQLNNWGQLAKAAMMVPVGVASNKIVGNKDSFSWQNVAMAAISTSLNSKLQMKGEMDGFWANTLSQTGMSLLQSGSRHLIQKALFSDGKWSTRDVITDSFGNALADNIVSLIKTRSQIKAEQQAKQKEEQAVNQTEVHETVEDNIPQPPPFTIPPLDAAPYFSRDDLLAGFDDVVAPFILSPLVLTPPNLDDMNVKYDLPTVEGDAVNDVLNLMGQAGDVVELAWMRSLDRKLADLNIPEPMRKGILTNASDQWNKLSLESLIAQGKITTNSLLSEADNIELLRLDKVNEIQVSFEQEKLVIKQTIAGKVTNILAPADPLHIDKQVIVQTIASTDGLGISDMKGAFVEGSTAKSMLVIEQGEIQANDLQRKVDVLIDDVNQKAARKLNEIGGKIDATQRSVTISISEVQTSNSKWATGLKIVDRVGKVASVIDIGYNSYSMSGKVYEKTGSRSLANESFAYETAVGAVDWGVGTFASYVAASAVGGPIGIAAGILTGVVWGLLGSEPFKNAFRSGLHSLFNFEERFNNAANEHRRNPRPENVNPDVIFRDGYENVRNRNTGEVDPVKWWKATNPWPTGPKY